MTERTLRCWAEFRDEVDRIREEYGYHQREVTQDIELSKGANLSGRTYRKRNTVLFRGHGDASWPIRTTLERKTDSRPIHVAGYLTYADYCVNEIESTTGRSWNMPTRDEREKEIRDTNDPLRVHLPAYDYLVYLRHHGFPSPLLDWSESPYVAAFFAFWERHSADSVAILVYIESVDGIRELVGGEPMITVLGPYVTTHPRHFAQKTQYTVATQWDREEQKHYFCSHDGVFAQSKSEQDILFKIILPSSAREEALRELADYNINPFTLFQTEEALVRAMEMKVFDIERGRYGA